MYFTLAFGYISFLRKKSFLWLLFSNTFEKVGFGDFSTIAIIISISFPLLEVF